MNRLIQGGLMVDPIEKTISKVDIYTKDGIIAAIGEKLTPKEEYEAISAEGFMVAPGLVDMHCHLRDPGLTHKEDIKSGTHSAVQGGFTSIACMPNTNPITDNEETVRYIIETANKVGYAHVYPIAAATKGSDGQELSDVAALKRAGAVAISDDGRPVKNDYIMKQAMKRAQKHGVAVCSHCEVMSLTNGGVMNEGAVSQKLGVLGIPGSSEEVMVARECILAMETGARVHICHVSTKRSVSLVRFAKQQGAHVTCETCPHYFSLTEQAVETLGAFAKVNPPLRTEEDRLAIIEGLKDGTIDAIATDHAPHTLEDKKDLLTAAPGFSGFETALKVSLTYLSGSLTLPEIICKMTVNPAKILGINKGRLVEGADADLVIFDADTEEILDASQFASKAKFSPFNGKRLCGRIEYTMLGGHIVYKNARG